MGKKKKSIWAEFLRKVVAVWSWIHSRAAILVLLLFVIAFLFSLGGTVWAEFYQKQTVLPFVDPQNQSVDAELAGTEQSMTLFQILDVWSACIYESAQVIFLNMSPHLENSNIGFTIARISAVLLTLLLAFEFVGFLLKDSFQRLRLTLSQSEKVLVCGLGRLGFEQTKRLIDDGKLVVVIEKDKNNHQIPIVENAGAIVFTGDVSDRLGFMQHVRREPTEVYLFTGEDHSNIAGLATIKALRDEQMQDGATLAPLTCYLHITDAGLEHEVRRSHFKSSEKRDATRNSIEIKIFNYFSQTGRELVTEEFAKPSIRPREDEVALYIVIGFGQMGKALVREIVELAHFENQKRARILVLAHDAERECDAYLERWGRLSPRVVADSIDSVEFEPKRDAWKCRDGRPLEPFRVENPDAVEYAANVVFCEHSGVSISEALSTKLVELSTDVGVRPAISFCFDDGEENFKLANQLDDHLRNQSGINVDFDQLNDKERAGFQRKEELYIPLFVFMPRSKSLLNVFGETSSRKRSLIPFGAVGASLERTYTDLFEKIAMSISASYDGKKDVYGNPLPIEHYVNTWRDKKYWERNSNLAAAEHALIKVQLFGYRLVKSNEPSTVSPTELSTKERAIMGNVEHNRWMAERLMVGWQFGEKSIQPPRRNSFRDHSTLPEEELAKDFDQNAAVIEYWKKFGYRLVKIDS